MRGAVSRRSRIALVAVAAFAFIALSALVARVLSVSNAERDAVVGVIRAQARGDERAVLARVHGCSADPRCRSQVREALARAQRPGDVKVLRFDGPTGLAVGGRRGTARIAWKTSRSLSVVQCVRLRTDGDPLTGYSVRVLALGAPIKRDASC
jgi:hypothetical protein